MKKLNESPDSFYINDNKVGYTRDDAVSFIIFNGGYIVYSTGGVNSEGNYDRESFNRGHVALAEAWTLKNKIEFGKKEQNPAMAEYYELSDTERAIWEECKHDIKTYGEMTPEAKKLANEFISQQRSYYDYMGDSNMLKGRLWKGKGIAKVDGDPDHLDHNDIERIKRQPKTDKVISFWNRQSDTKKMSDLVLKVLELSGENPKEYFYESDPGLFETYYEFLGKEDKTDYSKKYTVGGSTLNYSDFETLRTTMHTGGPIKGQQAKEKLCRILTKDFIEENPELRGFVPPDCGQVDSSYGSFKKKGWRDYLRPEAERGLAPSKDSGHRDGLGAPIKQVNAFFQGKAPPPESSLTFEPGQTLGMKGRTLGGFRARTQKELDAAWGDFMKKRESSDPKDISFKEWFSFLESNFLKKKYC